MSAFLNAGLLGGALALWIAPFGMPLKTPLGRVLHGLSLTGALACAVGLTAASHRQIDREDARRVTKGLQQDLWQESMALWAVSEQDRLRTQFVQPAPHLPPIPIPHHAIAPSPDTDPVQVANDLPEAEGMSLDAVLDEGVGIALLGNSGSGKSCVAQYLISALGNCQILVLDPHDDCRTWGQLPVISDYSNIAKQLELLLRELDSRRIKKRLGQPYDPIAVVCDEWPSIRLYCDQKGLDVADRFLLRMGSECRKYGMLVLFCSQSGNVRSLGLDGQGDFLENYVLIRLGRVAIKYARNLSDRTIHPRLKAVGYPCLVGEEVVIHPTHGHYPQAKKNQPPANLQPLKSLPLTVETVLPVAFLQSPNSMIETEPNLNRSESVQDLNQARESLNRLFSLPSPEFSSGSSVHESGVQMPTSAQWEKLNRIRECQANGIKSKNKILALVWGVSPGGTQAYKDASGEYDWLIELLNE